ncbi:SAF domain-containing protein [Lysinibacillus xylanilyticus]|uniref:SAF domain-containing protein n=1 Tax=Lysinibacillus xylanilyticus TaxID=582475 RepID=UPI0036D9A383
MQYKKNKEQAEQIQVLTQQIADISKEDLVDVVVAKQAIKAGTDVDEKMLQMRKWDRKYLSPNMLTDLSLVKDKIWKIDVSAEGPVTADMLAQEQYGPTDRLQLVIVDAVTPSLQVGDYIDLRMITPYGVNYVVMSKKRVTNIYDSGIEVVMSEAELMVYSGLLIDQYMNPGTMVYTSKYLDPTLQKSTYTMYVPPQDILDYMKVNANMLYPYLTSDNVQGLRSYIESTQPWTLYGPSTFQTVTQSIISKQEKITRSNNSLAASMKSARSEFVRRQAELAAQNGQTQDPNANAGQASTTTPPPGGGDANGQYVDSQGVKRDAQGKPVIDPSDLTTGVTDVKGGTGNNSTSSGQPPVIEKPSSVLNSVEEQTNKQP